jgi:hypothetical protein
VVEFGGDTREEADARAMKVMAGVKRKAMPHVKLTTDKEETKIWMLRIRLGATTFLGITMHGKDGKILPFL